MSRPDVRHAQLIGRLETALERRAALLNDPQTNVGRLLGGACDGIAGLVIERYGDVLIAQLRAGHLAVSEDAARAVCEAAMAAVGARAVYRKVFPRNRSDAEPALDALHRDPRPWVGDEVEPEFAVRESGVSYLVRAYDGYGTGLFLDHRERRSFVRGCAPGREVLNAFAHTCAFTVVAALGGASATVSVDVSRKFLEWGKRNLTANGVARERHQFICSDVIDYYKRAQRQGRAFDLVILDPPTFGRAKRARRSFMLSEDLDRLVAGAVALLRPGGSVLLSVNHQATSLRRLERAIVAAARAARRSCEWLSGPIMPVDFRGDPECAKSVVARVH